LVEQLKAEKQELYDRLDEEIGTNSTMKNIQRKFNIKRIIF